MERYILQKSKEQNNWYVATDTLAGLSLNSKKANLTKPKKQRC